MAHTARLKINSAGQVMVPMNLEGSLEEHGMLTPTKAIGIVVVLAVAVVGVIRALSYTNLIQKVGMSALAVFAAQFVIRKLILNENYYAKIFKRSQDNEVTTPDIFWSVPMIQESYGGSAILYVDGKIGIIIKAIRDTITGCTADMEELHYDSVSNFYREINRAGFKMLQMNIMEPAGNDPRVSELDKLVTKPSNPSIAKLMELQIGQIRKTTRETLYETEYFLLYTDKTFNSEKVMAEAERCARVLMQGAYNGYEILDRVDCIELMKNLYGVAYFDYGQATTKAYAGTNVSVARAMEIKAVRFADGREEKIDSDKKIKIQNLTSYVIRGDLKPGEWTVEDAISGKGGCKFNLIENREKDKMNSAGQRKEDDGPDKVYVNLDEDVPDVIDKRREREEARKKQEEARKQQEEARKKAEEQRKAGGLGGLFAGRKKRVEKSEIFSSEGKMGMPDGDAEDEKSGCIEEVPQQNKSGIDGSIKVLKEVGQIIDLE